MRELIGKSAVDIVALLESKPISANDTLDALGEQLRRVDADVNALPPLCFDCARKAVRDNNSILAGLHAAIKELTDVAGVKTGNGPMC